MNNVHTQNPQMFYVVVVFFEWNEKTNKSKKSIIFVSTSICFIHNIRAARHYHAPLAIFISPPPKKKITLFY